MSRQQLASDQCNVYCSLAMVTPSPLLKQILQFFTEGFGERGKPGFLKEISRAGPITIITWEFKHEIIQPEIRIGRFPRPQITKLVSCRGSRTLRRWSFCHLRGHGCLGFRCGRDRVNRRRTSAASLGGGTLQFGRPVRHGDSPYGWRFAVVVDVVVALVAVA